MVRGKFFVLSIKQNKPAGMKNYGDVGSEITLAAVGASEIEKSENNLFHKYTPSGEIKLTVDNPPAQEFFTLGKVVYVDFSEAPAE